MDQRREKIALKEFPPTAPGAHLCCLYGDEIQYRSFVLPYLKQGAERGEKTVFALDPHAAEEFARLLAEEFPETCKDTRRNKPRVLSSRDAYFKSGRFDPDYMLELLEKEIELAISEGYTGIRAAGEMSWALSGVPGSERLIEYEKKLDEFLPGKKCTALCIYNFKKLNHEMLPDIINTHSAVFPDGKPIKNIWGVHLASNAGSGESPRESRAFKNTPADFPVNAPGAFYRVSGGSGETVGFMSEEIKNITGRAAGEFIGKPVGIYTGMIHRDDREKVENAVKKSASGNGSYKVLYRILTPDNAIKWIEDSGRGVMGEDGELVCRDGIITDITSLKTDAEKSNEMLEKIGFVLNSVRANIDIIDSSYNLIYVDPGWKKTYGDYTNKKCYEYFYKNKKACRGCKIPAAIKSGEKQITMRTLSAESNRPIQVTTLPFKNKKGEQFVAEVNIDITDIKKISRKIDYFSVYEKPTGVYTKTFIKAELQRIDCEDNLPLGVTLCAVDLSGVKRPEAGTTENDLLARAAELLKTFCRESDIIGMWDKDKFIIIMPYTSGRRLRSFAERLQKTAGTEAKDKGGRISVFTGSALKGSVKEKISDIIKLAENALTDEMEKPGERNDSNSK